MIGDLFYQDYQQNFDDEGAEFLVAEAHGIMTGMLCVDQSLSFQAWENELRSARIFADDFYGRALECMIALFNDTRDKFEEGGFEFSPCLPDDEYPISKRTQALSEWCGGFLYGLGRAGVKISWPDPCKEIICDFIAISDVDPDSDEEDDNDEDSLMELIEYIRVGVELIRIELQSLDNPRKVH
ncbi:MAG: UPF0149 family protein [Methylococcales bacterium]